MVSAWAKSEHLIRRLITYLLCVSNHFPRRDSPCCSASVQDVARQDNMEVVEGQALHKHSTSVCAHPQDTVVPQICYEVVSHNTEIC
jgi:hypothetical protein